MQLWIAAVVCLVAVVLLSVYVQKDMKDMDIPSYFLVRVLSGLVIPDVFPTYSSDNAKLWRYRLNRTKKSANFRFNGTIVDVIVPTIDGSSIAAKVFRPPNSEGTALPVALWLHGGGWFTGSIVADEKLCGKISAYTNMVVVAAAYRLAPEHVYPTAVLDSHSAAKWSKTFNTTAEIPMSST